MRFKLGSLHRDNKTGGVWIRQDHWHFLGVFENKEDSWKEWDEDCSEKCRGVIALSGQKIPLTRSRILKMINDKKEFKIDWGNVDEEVQSILKTSIKDSPLAVYMREKNWKEPHELFPLGIINEII